MYILYCGTLEEALIRSKADVVYDFVRVCMESHDLVLSWLFPVLIKPISLAGRDGRYW